MARHRVSIEYRNQLGQSIEFGNFDPFKIMELSGFGTPETTISEINAYGRDGAIATQIKSGTRLLEINVMVRADSYEALNDRVQAAINVMNPHIPAKLIIRKLDKVFEIDVINVQGFDTTEGRGATYYKSTLQFKAMDPFFRDVSEYTKIVDLSEVINKMEFPLAIEEPYEFSIVEAGNLVTVNNPGSKPVGGLFKMTLMTEATNPRIQNVVTGEYFGFLGSFNVGDKLMFNTTWGSEEATYTPFQGTPVTAMNMVMSGSTFLELDNAADNVLQVQAADGVAGVISTLEFSPLVLGIPL